MHLPRQTTFNFDQVSLNSNGQRILGITGFFTTFACTVVILRLYVRIAILKSIGMDDYAMIVAATCSVAAFAFFVLEVHAGVGEHIRNPHLTSNLQEVLHYSYHHGWILVLGISAVKLSVGLFLHRLTQGKWFKRSIIIWIIFLFIFTLACLGTLIFQCTPVAAAWNFSLRANSAASCYDLKIFRSLGLFNGAINIFTDFLFATLPIPIILKLSINMKTKILLICILGLGYFACAASIIKEYLLSSFFENTDSFFNFSFNIWNSVELNTGILAASLPPLRPLFSSLLDTASSFRSRTPFPLVRRPSKSEIKSLRARTQLSYRFCQPRDEGHDPTIRLPLNLCHFKKQGTSRRDTMTDMPKDLELAYG